MRRRERSPVKSAGESAYPYKPPSSRVKPSVESAYPYERRSSRVPRSQRIEAENDEIFNEEEDLYGLEPSYTARQHVQDRLSVEPDDSPDFNIDPDVLRAYAYTSIRRAGSRRDSSISSFNELGPAGREAYRRLADRKGKGKYEGMAQLASISESMSEAMSESKSVPVGQRSRPADLTPAVPAPMTESIEADSPSSDTYSVFYLTPLPPLTITSYSDMPPPIPRRRTAHFVKRPIIIPEHTTAILIAKSANDSPTTATASSSRITAPTAAATSTTTTTRSTATAPATTTSVTHITTHLPPGPLTPESAHSEDEGFSEPTIVEAIETTSTAEALERSLFACMSQGYGLSLIHI